MPNELNAQTMVEELYIYGEEQDYLAVKDYVLDGMRAKINTLAPPSVTIRSQSEDDFQLMQQWVNDFGTPARQDKLQLVLIEISFKTTHPSEEEVLYIGDEFYRLLRESTRGKKISYFSFYGSA